jgi:hypothetical protein
VGIAFARPVLAETLSRDLADKLEKPRRGRRGHGKRR